MEFFILENEVGKYNYVVLGAGAQGVAVAYDLAKHGNVQSLILADADAKKAHEGALHVNALVHPPIVAPRVLDVNNKRELTQLFEGADAVVSAISFSFNEMLTDMAVHFGVHMVDLGGNTAVVQSQHKRNDRALRAGVTIIPDCGMGPGFNLSLANSALRAFPKLTSLAVYCGGLPQKPEGQLKYTLPFSLQGLVNEYSGFADILQNGKIKQKPCLGSVEKISLELGEFEASYTSGGLSTAPWTYQVAYPTLQNLKYMTLRYPGHWKLLRKFRLAGKLREELESRLGSTPKEFADIGIILVQGEGVDASGRKVFVTRKVVDVYDEKTGFTAMQRLTGFHASIMVICATEERIPKGVLAVEMINGDMIISEMAKRGIVTLNS